MKKKTRNFCKSVEAACMTARLIGFAPPVGKFKGFPFEGPDIDLCRALGETRDRFFEQLTNKLPRYQIPETASLFARGLYLAGGDDGDAAHVLPDGRLLVHWPGYIEPEVLTEAKYLHIIALRSMDFRCLGAAKRAAFIEFCRANLCKS